MKNKKDGKFGSFISFAIGFCVGVLIAPRTGEETRKILSEIGKQYIQKSSDWINEKMTQISEIADQYAENIKEYLEDIK